MRPINADHRSLRNAMTVEDLIQELMMLPSDAKVVFVCNYGDHCRTQQALPLETIQLMQAQEYLAESAYSQSGAALYEDEDGEVLDCDYEPPNVVYIR